MANWPRDDDRVSLFARLRSLPTAVQVSGVITAGVVLIDVFRGVIRDIVVPIIQLVRGIGACS
jgi:hypothetical protein